MLTHTSCKILFYLCLFAGSVTIMPGQSVVEAATEVLQNEDIAIVYEPALQTAAVEVLRLYPILRQELQAILGWRLNRRIRVVLIRTNQQFRQIARNSLIVAFDETADWF